MDVAPDKQNLDMVFSNTTYFIDFYQRQYKWNEEPVLRLLDDVFYKFSQEHKKYNGKDINLENLIERYSWYYLNTYVTNTINGKTFIVDGQQRLTTLTLVLIKLRHMSKDHNSQLGDWISSKIVGISGFKKEFWMNHESHKSTLLDLFDGKSLATIDTSSGITSENMVSNYAIIAKYLDKEIKDIKTYEAFVFYFLRRLVLICLNVEQTDVPMVFEVINDRGVRLKAYEILKGKLLGQVDKEELESLDLNNIWDSNLARIGNQGGDDQIDNYFQFYLRSKFSNTVAEARKIDKDYHRVIFLEDINAKLKLLHNPAGVKAFLQNEYIYYSNLFFKIQDKIQNMDNEYIYVYYNGLTEMSSQILLILSSCNLRDPDEDQKIKTISYEVDRLFCLLQLQRSYDSNKFNVSMYEISKAIRGADNEGIRNVFEAKAIELLSDARGTQAKDVVSYGFFKDTGIDLEKRFKRYFFARIESFIADQTKVQMRHSLYDLVANTGSVNGFHVEHILAENTDNHELFNNDLELFESERNRLGGLLLLKGKDNISSSNETYKKKLKSYANTLLWNETLRDDSYKSKKDFTGMIEKSKLGFRPMVEFGPSELEERHKLLFDIVKCIWK
jgi:uncharacterized protein with ParB-like and HNH nuclease domain